MGFLPKDSSPEGLGAVIRTVHSGEAAVAPRLLTRLIAAYVRVPRDTRPAPTGLDNTGNSRALDLSISTVKNHITSIFDKLGVRDRAQAVIAAYESGLVTARRRTGRGSADRWRCVG